MPPSLSPEPMGDSSKHDHNTPPVPRTQAQAQHPQPISKRDKKRSQLLEKIDDIIRTFSMNKDHEYRAQLQAIQVDINIILSVEPHRPEKVMEEHAEEIISLLMGYRGGDPEDIRKHLHDTRQMPNTGAIYAQFQQEVEEAEAARDAALATLAHEYQTKLRELEYNAMFQTNTARMEHKQLCDSIRHRLLNNIQMRRAKLNKEKEAYEIADSNPMYMHPNQYTITYPSSPGGVHGRRAKRHRGEVEDLPGYVENKRKNKLLQENGSPAPTRRPYEQDSFSKTTLWSTGDIIKSSSDRAAPIYSIEKLFPDKDIQFVHNTASISGYEHVVRHKFAGDSADSDLEKDDESEDEDGAIAAALANGAPGMERVNSHLTRSARNGVQNGNLIPTGIEAITGHIGSETARKIASSLPRLPPGAYLANDKMYKSYQKDAPNTPAGVSENDVARDLARMKKAKEINDRLGIGANLVDEELKDGELLEAASMTADMRREAPVAWIRSEESVRNGGGSSRGRLRSGTPASRVGSAMGRRARYN